MVSFTAVFFHVGGAGWCLLCRICLFALFFWHHVVSPDLSIQRRVVVAVNVMIIDDRIYDFVLCFRASVAHMCARSQRGQFCASAVPYVLPRTSGACPGTEAVLVRARTTIRHARIAPSITRIPTATRTQVSHGQALCIAQSMSAVNPIWQCSSS